MKRTILLYFFIGMFLGVSAQVKIEKFDAAESIKVIVWDSLQFFANFDPVPASLKRQDYKEYEQADRAWKKQLATKVLTKEMREAITNYRSSSSNPVLSAMLGFNQVGEIRYLILLVDEKLADAFPNEQWLALYEHILKEKSPLTAYFNFKSEDDCAEYKVLFGLLMEEDGKFPDLEN